MGLRGSQVSERQTFDSSAAAVQLEAQYPHCPSQRKVEIGGRIKKKRAEEK